MPAKFYYSINGRRVERGVVIRLHATGQRVRFHAISKWNTLYWTADLGCTFARSKAEALTLGQAHLDIVEG